MRQSLRRVVAETTIFGIVIICLTRDPSEGEESCDRIIMHSLNTNWYFLVLFDCFHNVDEETSIARKWQGDDASVCHGNELPGSRKLHYDNDYHLRVSSTHSRRRR